MPETPNEPLCTPIKSSMSILSDTQVPNKAVLISQLHQLKVAFKDSYHVGYLTALSIAMLQLQSTMCRGNGPLPHLALLLSTLCSVSRR